MSTDEENIDNNSWNLFKMYYPDNQSLDAFY